MIVCACGSPAHALDSQSHGASVSRQGDISSRGGERLGDSARLNRDSQVEKGPVDGGASFTSDAAAPGGKWTWSDIAAGWR